MIKPSITVVIPSHLRSHLLNHTLNSLVCQTDPLFEIIVVSDIRDNDAENIIRSFKATLNIYYYEIDYSTGGPSKSRNFGVSVASGNFICFLDDDDLFLPNKIASLRNFLFTHDIDFLYHPLYLSTSILDPKQLYCLQSTYKKKVIGSNPPFVSSLHSSLLNYGNHIATSSVLISKKCFTRHGGFNESSDYNIFEDYDLWVRLSRANIRWAYFSKPLGVYYLSPQGISRSFAKRLVVLKSIHKLLLNNQFRIWHFYVFYRINFLSIIRSPKFSTFTTFTFYKVFMLLLLSTYFRCLQIIILNIRRFFAK